MNEFFGKSIISVRDLDKQKLESIFDATNKIIDMDGDQRREIARGKTLGYLFFEPSTRTRLSFEAAMALLVAHRLELRMSYLRQSTREKLLETL